MKASKLINTVIPFAIVMAGCCICFNACKKDKAPVNDEVTADVLDNLAASGTNINIPINDGDSVSQSTGVHTRRSPICFPVLLTDPAKTDVEITASIDENPRVGQVFDSIYKAGTAQLRPGMFTILGSDEVVIKAGQTVSTDSIKVLLKDISGIKQPGLYVITIPVRLNTSSPNASLKSRLMFGQYKVIVVK